MSLRDELAKFAACPKWLDETIKIIERALAAERAATIEQCVHAMQTALSSREPYSGAWHEPERVASGAISGLPRDRSALDKMLVQALAAERAATIEECTRAVVAEWWDTIDEDVPRDRFALDQAVQGSAREAILAQARREQKEIARAIEFAVEWTIKQLTRKEDWPASWDAGFPSYKVGALAAYRAAAIRAQEKD